MQTWFRIFHPDMNNMGSVVSTLVSASNEDLAAKFFLEQTGNIPSRVEFSHYSTDPVAPIGDKKEK